MATHSSTLAWEILWTEELGGLQSTVEHYQSNLAQKYVHKFFDTLSIES